MNQPRVTERMRLRQAAEMRGETPPLAAPGEPLTDAERETLRALAIAGPSAKDTARLLRVSLNTVRYRLGCVRCKYGLAMRGELAWPVLREAVRRGDVALSDETVPIRAFVAHLRTSLPAGPLGDGMRDWLELHTGRYLRQRGDEVAA